MRKIAFINQKGGVGKSTTAVNMAAALAELDRKILLIDLDPQSNASISFGLNTNELKATIYEVLVQKATVEDAIINLRANLDILPANIELSGAEVELVGMIGREHALADGLKDIPGDRYDYVLIDCPPSLGVLNINALAYATDVIIPLQCEFFALQGISLLLKTINMVKTRLNPPLEIRGVLPCMFDVRRGLAAEVVTEIETFFQGKVMTSRIRTNVRLAEAPSHGMTIMEYAPDSYGARDYRQAARELINIFEGVEIAAPSESDIQPSQLDDRGNKVFSLAEKIRRTKRARVQKAMTRGKSKTGPAGKRGRKPKTAPAKPVGSTDAVRSESAAQQQLETAIEGMPKEKFDATNQTSNLQETVNAVKHLLEKNRQAAEKLTSE
ncbi:ParA family protein [Planctomycetota bacterium]